jgi:hypothetical protein
MTTYATTYYAYDKSQRMTNQYSATNAYYFVYNQRNMATQILNVGGSDIPHYFTYNALGERAIATDEFTANPPTYLTYDGGKLLTEKDTTGTTVGRYRSNTSVLDSMGATVEAGIYAGTVFSVNPVFDHTGSVRSSFLGEGTYENYVRDGYGRQLCVGVASGTGITGVASRLGAFSGRGLLRTSVIEEMYAGWIESLLLTSPNLFVFAGFGAWPGGILPQVPGGAQVTDGPRWRFGPHRGDLIDAPSSSPPPTRTRMVPPLIAPVVDWTPKCKVKTLDFVLFAPLERLPWRFHFEGQFHVTGEMLTQCSMRQMIKITVERYTDLNGNPIPEKDYLTEFDTPGPRDSIIAKDFVVDKNFNWRQITNNSDWWYPIKDEHASQVEKTPLPGVTNLASGPFNMAVIREKRQMKIQVADDRGIIAERDWGYVWTNENTVADGGDVGNSLGGTSHFLPVDGYSDPLPY